MLKRRLQGAGRPGGRPILSMAGEIVTVVIFVLAFASGFLLLMVGPDDFAEGLLILGLCALGLLALGFLIAIGAGIETIAGMARTPVMRRVVRIALGLFYIACLAGMGYLAWVFEINPLAFPGCWTPGCIGD